MKKSWNDLQGDSKSSAGGRFLAEVVISIRAENDKWHYMLKITMDHTAVVTTISWNHKVNAMEARKAVKNYRG